MTIFASTDPDTAATLAAIFERSAARTRMIAEARPANKASVCDALAAAGITIVVVRFDGTGDSGQIEDIAARVGETNVELPDARITLLDPNHDGSGVERREVTLRETIEELAYDCLAETHGGWETDEGAYGEFTFDVVARTIGLEYNERYLETHFYSEGGLDGTSLSPCALVRPEVGRDRRRLHRTA